MLVNGAWLAAPPVRSVAPRLRDPCASVRRRTGGVDGVCRHQFLLAWAAGSASRFLVRDAYGRNYMACQCVFWVVLGTFANPVLESLLETAFGKQDVRYSVQLRIPAARARERAAFEPAGPCCKRRGVASSSFCNKQTSRQQQSAASRPTPSCAAQQQSSRDAASGNRSTLSAREAPSPQRERIRDDARHSTIVLLAGQY